MEQSGIKHKLALSQVIQLHPAAEDHDHALKVKALGTIADELAKIDAGGKAFFEAKAKTASDELSGGTDPFQQGQVRLFGMPIRQFRE